MDNKKAWYESKTLWGLFLSLASLLTIVLGDAGIFELQQDVRSQRFGVNLCGLGLAGFGRVFAKAKLKD